MKNCIILIPCPGMMWAMARTNGILASVSTEPSVSVAVEVADREGVAPTELTPPLHDVVDPDALDALFARRNPPDRTVVVSFDYLGYQVEVRGDGTVDVRD